jgi:hypothetical protein
MVVEYKKQDPTGRICPAVITYPAHLVEVPAFGGPVVFEHRSAGA